MKELAVYLQLDNGFDGFLDWLLKLRKELGIEHRLSEIGIEEQHIARIAVMATEDPSAQSNPILFNSQQYQAILMTAIHGDLFYNSETMNVGFAETP